MKKLLFLSFLLSVLLLPAIGQIKSLPVFVVDNISDLAILDRQILVFVKEDSKVYWHNGTDWVVGVGGAGGGGAVDSVNGLTGTVVLNKSHVGLTNADNTSDANKPVSTATQTALDLKAPIAGPTFTGTVGGISKSMVGLGSADNTSDASKPVSTAMQTALDLKSTIASPTFTGTVSGISKGMVGLGSVDNTTDAGKPISTATQNALDTKQATLVSATNIKTVNGTTLLGSGDLVVGGGGGSSQFLIPFYTDAGVNLAFTNQAVAEQFLANSNRNITKADLANYTQVRIISRVVVGSASVNTPRIILKYHTAFTTTIGTFVDIGTSAVLASLTTVGLIDSGWINLAAGAKADVFLTVTMIGGDAAADPALGMLVAQFK